MTDLPAFDATALALLGHDVALIPDAAMKNPTPCDGWTVTDLINHMNEEHEAIACTELPPIEVTGDPRDAFARIAARCLAAFERAGETVTLPKYGPIPTETVFGVHGVDMLVHRWDLARALGDTPTVPTRLAEIALPLARISTAPGSPLNGPGGVYRPPLPEDPARPAIDNLAALLGRDPAWSPSP
ncbi:TIGR03086 family metal-binding protein [Actinomadura madurae]|uniref:TIGR03086 family metal-binding protein n=1 Tax=Actinomadura madurae TaxID=1993 RepID=UPI000D9DC3E7|nr:TIGR03086 family metal-binding protein [Actinomadura madurae]SPT51657.1 Mycothiol maleylpyruvate isomerase N-terminal domain [Actinomadura madurae]